MDHPGEAQLVLYLDAEVDAEVAERVRSHLRACPDCHARADRYGEVSALLRSLAEQGAFAAEGEFWVRLSGRLSPRPPSRWPLVPLLPPVLMAAFGSALQLILTIVVTVFALGALGLLPSPASIVAGSIPEVLGHPWLENTLYAWLGWSGDAVVASATTRWEMMDAVTQHGLLLGGIGVSLVAALSTVAVLYLTWAVCWPGLARREREGD